MLILHHAQTTRTRFKNSSPINTTHKNRESNKSKSKAEFVPIDNANKPNSNN